MSPWSVDMSPALAFESLLVAITLNFIYDSFEMQS